VLKHVQDPTSRLSGGCRLPRHLHGQAYATLVLEGGYEEAGEAGRWCVRPAQVLLHAPFSIHCNRTHERGARLLNLPLPFDVRASRCGTVADPDRVAQLAERDPAAAVETLLHGWSEDVPPLADAPDRLALALSAPGAVRIQEWSHAHGIARQTAFRGFRAVYGVGPTRYRVEARARHAWRLIMAADLTLADAALAAGYADQAHMCRDVKALTGRTPGAWANEAALQHSFKHGGGPR
jgi:AraC-like DNA-binding protein